MKAEYKVKAFIPTVKGCGTADIGWDEVRCKDFENFINTEAQDGWSLHTYENRSVAGTRGCGTTVGVRLVCIFERKN